MHVNLFINGCSRPVFDLSLDSGKDGWQFSFKTQNFTELWSITPSTEIRLMIADSAGQVKNYDLAALQITEEVGTGFAIIEGMDRAMYEASVTPAEETAPGTAANAAAANLGTQAGINVDCDSTDAIHNAGSSQTVRQSLEHIAQGTGRRLISTGTGLKIGTGAQRNIPAKEKKRARNYSEQIHQVRMSKATPATHSGTAYLEGDSISCGGILYQGLFGFPDGSDLGTSPFWDTEDWVHGWPTDYAGVEDMLDWYADHWHVPNECDPITSVSAKQGLPIKPHLSYGNFNRVPFYTEADINWATIDNEPDPDNQGSWYYRRGGKLRHISEDYDMEATAEANNGDLSSFWRSCYISWYEANEIRNSKSTWGNDDSDAVLFLLPAPIWALAEYTFGTDGHLKRCRLLKDLLIGRIDPDNLNSSTFDTTLGRPFWQKELLPESLPGIFRYAGYAPRTGNEPPSVIGGESTPIFDDAWVYRGEWRNIGEWQLESIKHWQNWLSRATRSECRFEAVYSIKDFYYNPWRPYENSLHLLPKTKGRHIFQKVPAISANEGGALWDDQSILFCYHEPEMPEDFGT